MRKTLPESVEKYRVKHGLYASTSEYGCNGMFQLIHDGNRIQVMISDGMGWDHVSVSMTNRCPRWSEMCWIKSLFFEDDEWVMQYHPARALNISIHPNCLHLWRPQNEVIPKPPEFMV
jgi:hypothetical protein